MKNRINSFKTGQNRKRKRIVFSDDSLQNVGATQFNLGVLLQDGPCFQHSRHAFAWEKGWRLTSAYHEGYAAGLNGNPENENPYTRPENTAPANMDLAEEWRKGYRAAWFAMSTET